MGLCRLWQQRGTHWKVAGISPVQWYQTVNWAFMQNCRWDLQYSWSGEHRGEQSHVQSLRAEECTGLLSFSIQPDRGSQSCWPVPSAWALLFVLLVVLILLLSVLPWIGHCFLIATASSSSTWFPCSLFFCIPAACFFLFLRDVQVLTEAALRLEGETDFLVSFPGRSRAVLELCF